MQLVVTVYGYKYTTSIYNQPYRAQISSGRQPIVCYKPFYVISTFSADLWLITDDRNLSTKYEVHFCFSQGFFEFEPQTSKIPCYSFWLRHTRYEAMACRACTSNVMLLYVQCVYLECKLQKICFSIILDFSLEGFFIGGNSIESKLDSKDWYYDLYYTC